VKPYYQDKWVTIYHGDCREMLPQLDVKVDLVLTDPPYPKDFLPLFDVLGRESSRLLPFGKYLISYSGQAHLPDVLNNLRQHLEYRWLAVLLHKQSAVVWSARAICRFKPLVIFSNGINGDTPLFVDVIEGAGAEKELHRWQQGEAELGRLIIKFSDSGQTILDPFLGSGTTCFCAKKLNRYSIGIEIEEKYCEIAARRCSQEVMELA
jgi:site-specific DNA-methyltransferase (adenine-specific)